MKQILFAAALLACCSASGAQNAPCPPPVSHIQIASGEYSPEVGVTFRLRHFSAALVPIGKTAPSCYEKLTVVSHAEIFVSNESLTKVFTAKLGGAESKIRDFTVHNDTGKVRLNGRINKIIPIEFAIEGPVTTDGVSIILDANKIKADGVPIKLLLQMVGEHLSSVLKINNVKGIAIDESRLSFSPEQVAHLKGYIEAVIPSSEGLTLRYGPRPRSVAPLAPHP